MNSINTIIFDLGGVLIDWNPRHLYRKIFRTEAAVNYFLDNITTNDWNELQDAGRPLDIATSILVQEYPHYEPEIEAYYDRWEEEMLGGAIEGTVEILKYFIDHPKFRVLALTNWSAETFPVARKKFEFLDWFEGILVSGEEKIKKPDPRIYNLLIERYELDPGSALFIDDSQRNINGARECGIIGLHFTDPVSLQKRLLEEGIIETE